MRLSILLHDQVQLVTPSNLPQCLTNWSGNRYSISPYCQWLQWDHWVISRPTWLEHVNQFHIDCQQPPAMTHKLRNTNFFQATGGCQAVTNLSLGLNDWGPTHTTSIPNLEWPVNLKSISLACGRDATLNYAAFTDVVVRFPLSVWLRFR